MGSRGTELGAEKPLARNDRYDGHTPSDAIDLEYLRRFTLGNAALEEEVLQLFMDHAPLYLEQLRNAKTGKEWAEAVHTIKGSSAAIGARRLTRIAEMAERLHLESADAVTHDENLRAQAIAAVTQAMEDVRGCIQRLLALQ